MAPAIARARLQPGRPPLVVRVLATVVLALVVPLVGQALTAAGHAVRETEQTTEVASADQQREKRQQALLRKALAQREQALAQIDHAAEVHEEELAAEVARLATLGFTGSLEDLTYVLPLADYRLSAGFGRSGPLWESTHTGQDFGAGSGTTLVAVGAGVVTEVGDAGPYGLRTVLTLEDGTVLWYAHQLSTMVQTGEQVEVGQPIGLVGSTGNSTGPHLHLEVRPGGGAAVDPMSWFQAVGLVP